MTSPFRSHNEITWDGEVVRCATGPQHGNAGGGIHGGVIATMLDAVMGGTAVTAMGDGRRAVTTSLTVNYLAPGVVGDVLEARAVVRRLGRTLAHVDGTLTRAGSDEPLATASGVFAVTGRA